MAKSTFDHYAASYGRFRPRYPPCVVERIRALTGQPDDRWALDLGCGPGFLAGMLSTGGWRVIAADASEAMLRLLDDKPAGCRRLRMTAESIGIADGAISLVTCAQSFHWFNPRNALAQIDRILAPGGLLCLIWQDRCPTSALVTDFHELIHRWNPSYRREYGRQDWWAKLRSFSSLQPVSDTSDNWTWRLTPDQFVGYAHTLSFLRNTVPRAETPRLTGELHALADRRQQQGWCEIPMTIRVLTARHP